MISAFPSAPAGLFDVSEPGSADTIHVTTSYTVDAGDTLDLDGSPGFKLEVKNGASVSLQINGSVNLDGGADHDKVAGVLSSRSINGDAQVTVGGSGSLSVMTEARDGQAVGVVLVARNASFVNYGDVHVSALNGLAAGVAAQGSDAAAMVNNGTMEVEALGVAYGMYGLGGTAQAVNNGSVTCTAAVAAGMVFVGTSSAVVNNGFVTAVSTDAESGLAVGVAVGEGTFVNNEHIYAHGPNIAIGAEVINLGSVVNNGAIAAVSTNGAQLSAGMVLSTDAGGGIMVNNGLIRGDLSVVGADAYDVLEAGPVSNDVIINNGKLLGDVALGGGSDGISNLGRIVGDVDLGDGGDILISNRGHVSGVITGGLGNDRIDATRAGDVVYGDGLTDALGDGDDDLRGMKGDDQLFGGQGADTLSGGLGADTLTGGLGDDTFRFIKLAESGKAVVDLIADLTGADHIDLSAIDADSVAGGDQAFHLVGAFSNAAGELLVSYDSGTGLTTIAGDTDGDGVADLRITASGDHHDFTNFVL